MASQTQQAQSRNLNVGFLHFPTAVELYRHIWDITAPGGDFTVRNFVAEVGELFKAVRKSEGLLIDSNSNYTEIGTDRDFNLHPLPYPLFDPLPWLCHPD